MFAFLALQIESLSTVNAVLNGVCTVLLLCGYLAIRQKKIDAHRCLMLAAFATSILFLASYVVYHTFGQTVHRFVGPALATIVYRIILFSHIILAALVPVLAMRTIYLGIKDRRASHRRLARWTFPIWLYVSVTGIVVYLMLYVLKF